ncbi:MAG: UDP-N-acetylmuramate--L-alanine ligase [Acidimicrobiia bacterium]
MIGSELAGRRRIHLVGVAGAGMSALAKLLHQARKDRDSSWKITGSDLRAGIELGGLAALGIETWSGHQPQWVEGAELVVASSAVPESDPELARARQLGIPIWRRPELLSALTAAVPTVGATGTHGKTTTTALLILGARELGLDPSFVVGGDLVDLATNAHYGQSPLFILEVDEAFGTFESVTLTGLIVTSMEPEHLDFFGTAAEMEAAFGRVTAAVSGPVLCCADDDGAMRLCRDIGGITYGFENKSDWSISSLQLSSEATEFDLMSSKLGEAIPVRVRRPGRHVALNAAAVLALLGELGYDPTEAVAGLARFNGVKRRFENRGIVKGVKFIDDYAHHPTEVAATIAAARLQRPRRLWAVFQPHLYSRTEALYSDFGQALTGGDRVLVTDVYAARELPVAGVTGELVAQAARDAGANVLYVPHRSEIASALASLLTDGDLVLTMGAGDITHLPTEVQTLLVGAS